jgi:autotransporter-associated beta strand protein
VKLFTNVGGQFNDFHNLTFADNATRSIDTIDFNDVPYTGRWRPEDPLTTFQGDDATGIWTLVIHDTAFADEGSLNSWSLSFNTSEVFQTTDATGHYEFDNLPAGQYTIREQPQPGWTPIDPSLTDIPAAVWSNSKWVVNVVGLDDFSDPAGPDSHRNVKNVDFGNFANPGSLQGVVYSDLDSSSSKTPNEPGLAGWTVFLDANGNGSLDTGTVNTTVSSTTASAINNFFVVQSKILFGVPATVSDVNLSLGITHTYDADLTVYLVSPSGTRVKLFSGVGGSGDDFTGTIFDDSASQSITIGTAPFSQSYQPQEALSAFNGQSALGYWTLEITDSTPADNGTLNAWSLTITGDELSTTTDAQGHYSFANLPPGVYAVDTVQKAGWTRTEVPGEVILDANAVSANVNFGNHSPLAQPGDYNNDGSVDSGDYLTWRKALGSSVPSFTGADGDGDGLVGQSDYDIWRLNFGHSAAPGGSGSSVGSGLAAVKSTSATVGGGLMLNSASSYTGSTSLSAGTLSVSPNVGADLVLTDSAITLAAQPTVTSLSNADPIGTSVQAPSTSQNSTASVLAFGVALETSAASEDELVDVSTPAAAGSQSDLGLLAWLESSPVAAGVGNEWGNWNAESSASSSSDSSESVDAAFATLEDSALVGAAI